MIQSGARGEYVGRTDIIAVDELLNLLSSFGHVDDWSGGEKSAKDEHDLEGVVREGKSRGRGRVLYFSPVEICICKLGVLATKRVLFQRCGAGGGGGGRLMA